MDVRTVITPIWQVRKLRLRSLSHPDRGGWSQDVSPVPTTWPLLQNVIYVVVWGPPKWTLRQGFDCSLFGMWSQGRGRGGEVRQKETSGCCINGLVTTVGSWPQSSKGSLGDWGANTFMSACKGGNKQGSSHTLPVSLAEVVSSRVLTPWHFLPAPNTGQVLSSCWRKPPEKHRRLPYEAASCKSRYMGYMQERTGCATVAKFIFFLLK